MINPFKSKGLGRGLSSLSYNPANLGYVLDEETFFNKTNYIAQNPVGNFLCD